METGTAREKAWKAPKQKDGNGLEERTGCMPRRERQRWQLSVESKEETKDDWIERGTVLPFIVDGCSTNPYNILGETHRREEQVVDTEESAQRQKFEFVEITLQEVKEEPNWREQGGVRSSFRHGLGVTLGSVSPPSCCNVESLSDFRPTSTYSSRFQQPLRCTIPQICLGSSALTALSYLYPKWPNQVLVRGSES